MQLLPTLSAKRTAHRRDAGVFTLLHLGVHPSVESLEALMLWMDVMPPHSTDQSLLDLADRGRWAGVVLCLIDATVDQSCRFIGVCHHTPLTSSSCHPSRQCGCGCLGPSCTWRGSCWQQGAATPGPAQPVPRPSATGTAACDSCAIAPGGCSRDSRRRSRRKAQPLQGWAITGRGGPCS